MTDLIGAHGRNDLGDAALERPSGLEAEPCTELFEGDVVATFVDERVVGNDLGFWDLLVNEFGDLPQGVRPDAPWIVAKRKRVTPNSGLLRASSTTSEATLVRA